MTKTKGCTKCGRTNPIDNYYPHKGYKDNRSNWCKACHSKYQKQKTRKEGRKKDKQRIKREVFDYYGGRCGCCGETISQFLTIDHIHGGGCKHRKEIGVSSGYSFYYWLKKNNFPSGFQVLCFNCNCGRQVNGGVCPHEQERVR